MKRTVLLSAALTATTSVAMGQVTLVGHYELNETSGTMALDSSGNGFHGTYMGGVTQGIPGAGATSGTAVDFDGSTGYVVIPGNAVFDAARSATGYIMRPFETAGEVITNPISRVWDGITRVDDLEEEVARLQQQVDGQRSDQVDLRGNVSV